MSRRLSKKIFSTLLLLCFLAADFNVSGDALEIAYEKISGGGIVDRIYLAQQNKNVVDNFKFSPSRAKAALDSSELEYMADIGPINGSTAANYVYASFFNPAASGKTAVIKRIAVKSNAVAAANYVNLTVRRISTASGGTQLLAADIPKKNNGSSNSVVELRHTGAAVSLSGTVDSRIMGQPISGGIGQFYSYRDITFGADDEKLVLQPGEGVAVYQEAAGDADQRIRSYFEWEEVASAPSAQSEFLFAFPRVEVAATANYAYNSFFNPAASGKSAVVKRIWFGSETCDTTAVYTNNISLRRTTSASAGTAITASNVPKKNTSSANSVMDFRRTGVTVGLVGTAEARLGIVTPCAAAGQPSGFQQIDFEESDEKLILQQGEGIALISEATGDVDQLVRMIVEWDEVSVASTPASQGEYFFAFHKISNEAIAPAINTTFYTFFNPAGSGKSAVVKRLGIRNNADTTATYSAFNWRRLSAASAGTQIAAIDIMKKHTATSNSLMELRSCGTTCATAISATYSGTADSRLLAVNGAGAAGQVIGQREVSFEGNEKIVLQPGEGVGFYLDVAAGDIDHFIKAFVEWDEEASAPSAQGEYLIDAGPINGSTSSGYNYISFFNPAASGKTSIIKKVSLRIDSQAGALYIPMSLRRSTSASAGTQITAANIPKKNNGSANSIMEIRRTGVTVGLSGAADSRIASIHTAGAVGSAVAPSTSGYRDFIFQDDERIILKAGEGIALYQEAAGDADFRVKVLIEWEEVASASTPATQDEYLLSSGPVVGSLVSGYVYSSFFNPAGSGKNYSVKRIEIRSNRTGTLVIPGYIPATVRRITASSGGTLMTQANVPKKHTSTATTSAEIRSAGPSATLAGANESRLLGVTTPGAANQYGDYENRIIYQDEMILKPGEGVALYQEAAAGDVLMQFRMGIEWSESDVPTGGGSLTVDFVDSGGSSVASPSTSLSGIGFDWSSQVSNGTLGISSQKIRISNTTTTATWNLSLAATASTNLWTSGGNTYDFNGSAVVGRLQINPSSATISPQGGCVSTGLTKGSATYFVQGTQDTINLVVAGPTAQTDCYWDITGIDMVQDIPALQNTGSYSLNLMVTVI